MKAKLLRPYTIDMTHTVCAGAEVEIVNGYCTSNGYVYCCIMSDGTQREINSNDLQIIDYTPYIDWQKVRIKAAIAAMQGFCSNSSIEMTINDMAKLSVEQADDLIEELKKKK